MTEVLQRVLWDGSTQYKVWKVVLRWKGVSTGGKKVKQGVSWRDLSCFFFSLRVWKAKPVSKQHCHLLLIYINNSVTEGMKRDAEFELGFMLKYQLYIFLPTLCNASRVN